VYLPRVVTRVGILLCFKVGNQKGRRTVRIFGDNNNNYSDVKNRNYNHSSLRYMGRQEYIPYLPYNYNNTNNNNYYYC